MWAGLGEIVQPVLGQVDDDALARTGRENVAPGQGQLFARARQPYVDSGIGTDDLVVAEAETMGDVGERVLVDRDDIGVSTDDRRAIRRQRVETRCSGAGRRRRDSARNKTPQEGPHVPR